MIAVGGAGFDHHNNLPRATIFCGLGGIGCVGPEHGGIGQICCDCPWPVGTGDRDANRPGRTAYSPWHPSWDCMEKLPVIAGLILSQACGTFLRSIMLITQGALFLRHKTGWSSKEKLRASGTGLNFIFAGAEFAFIVHGPNGINRHRVSKSQSTEFGKGGRYKGRSFRVLGAAGFCGDSGGFR